MKTSIESLNKKLTPKDDIFWKKIPFECHSKGIGYAQDSD